jgi:hypothetical protein
MGVRDDDDAAVLRLSGMLCRRSVLVDVVWKHDCQPGEELRQIAVAAMFPKLTHYARRIEMFATNTLSFAPSEKRA